MAFFNFSSALTFPTVSLHLSGTMVSARRHSQYTVSEGGREGGREKREGGRERGREGRKEGGRKGGREESEGRMFTCTPPYPLETN